MSSLPPLVLEILPPATLAFALLSSLAAFAFLHHSFRSKPALSLPTHDRDDDESAYRASHAQTEQEIKDPFNLYDPIVSFLDGTPIDPDRFWSGLVRFKLPVLVGSVLLLLIASVDLTSPLTNIPSSSSTNPTAWGLVDQLARWTVYGLTTWLAWLSLSYVEGDVPSHWRLTLHLASLFGTALVVRGLQVLLPREKHLEQEHQHRHRDSSTDHGKLAAVVDWLPFAEVGLLLLITIISVSIPRGPKLHFPIERLYTSKIAAAALEREEKQKHSSPNGKLPFNTSGENNGCIANQLMFSYAGKVAQLGNSQDSLEVHDLPALPAHLRALPLFTEMRKIYGLTQKRLSQVRGSGWNVLRKILIANRFMFVIQFILAIITAILYYAPAYYLQKLVEYLELDTERQDPTWGWIYCLALFTVAAANYVLTGVLWSISTTMLQSRIKIQLNTILFSKTLLRQDVAGGAPTKASLAAGESSKKGNKDEEAKGQEESKADEEDISSKSQVMTLMTVDVDRVADFSFHAFAIVDSPIEIVVGALFLWKLLGISSLLGLLTALIGVPINSIASKYVVRAQDGLMEARDERTALMNEVLGGVRMIKFMGWERSFEKRIQVIRKKELGWQKRNYVIEVAFNLIWAATPVFVTLVAFLHYVYWRGLSLSPSIAFTAVAVFGELRYALNALPETFISILQGFVSLKRIEKYLSTTEIEPVVQSDSQKIQFNSATITWPRDRASAASGTETPAVMERLISSSVAATPKNSFVLQNLTLAFPENELTLICGRLGSGKTLLLLALLGEADLLTGQLICPRSAPDAMLNFSTSDSITKENWIVPSLTAYVPQTAWLQNDSIKKNILFGLPDDEERYRQTLEACSLLTDLDILEDGDETEIGERGQNLSGGQKARISLARAVYSRASIVLLDDVLSAVDAHTAHHLFHACLKGPLMQNRTVVLVSHHVALTAPGAAYIVALDNGAVDYAGDRNGFLASGILKDLVTDDPDQKKEPSTPSLEEPTPKLINIEDATDADLDAPAVRSSGSSATMQPSGNPLDGDSTPTVAPKKRTAPRKLIEDEKRAVGRISGDIWWMYFRSQGSVVYWTIFTLLFLVAAVTPVLENGWLRIWSSSYSQDPPTHGALYYIGIYTVLTLLGVALQSLRYASLYYGSLVASERIHDTMLERVLFATVRFHDTVSRGRLLNRFGKDLEGVDSSLADNFGRTVIYGLNLVATFVSIASVGGWPFAGAAVVLGFLYYQIGSTYSQASRDMRRLDSTTRSPLYSLYGETIAGVSVIRAFGASANTLREMMRCVDSNLVCFVWMWSLNRWLSARFNLLSAALLGATGVAVLIAPSSSISAATAGFALAFANTVASDMLFIVRRFVALEQSMVAMERIKEYSELAPEAPEFIEPRPPASWPASGKVVVEDLVIKYAEDLPPVLHKISFEVEPCSKVGIVGPTGCGKSTLALSFFRFVEATTGKIVIDDIDISTLGLTDLRSRVTIIPQDPTILSGTLRSTLDVFGEYSDHEIYESLRRVHLIPAEGSTGPAMTTDAEGQEINTNVFKSLDNLVSENGDNFSSGEKQLLCMARAILRRNKVLIMDEATASIDYETDTLINTTIREEFSSSTILTIAHRLRTVIDFDKVMVLNAGFLVEYDEPHTLLQNPHSRFSLLCRATGKGEYATLKKLAQEASVRRAAAATTITAKSNPKA